MGGRGSRAGVSDQRRQAGQRLRLVRQPHPAMRGPSMAGGAYRDPEHGVHLTDAGDDLVSGCTFRSAFGSDGGRWPGIRAGALALLLLLHPPAVDGPLV